MSVLEKMRRLREMPLEEIASRSMREARISWERLHLLMNGRPAGRIRWRDFVDIGRLDDPGRTVVGQDSETETEVLHGYFVRRPSRFFFSSQDQERLVTAYARTFPERIAELHSTADELCAHRFRIFAYPPVNGGPQIAWRSDLVHGIASGLEHWSRIAYLDFSKVGDSKVVWEPNRHQHLVTLAQAYFVTGEERYAEECLRQFSDWLRDNPHPRGINWASSLEVAFRAWSWLWVLHLLLPSRALTGEFIAQLLFSIRQHANHIAANLSTYFSPNTHLLGEGFALFSVGLVLPELQGGQAWAGDGRQILLAEIDKQVFSDGIHREQSTYYHRYAVEFFLSAAILAEQNGCPFPEHYHSRLKEMVAALAARSCPTGLDPIIGDADGGRVLALAPFDPRDLRPIIGLAATFYGLPEYANCLRNLPEEAFWLLGGERALARFKSLPKPSPAAISRAFAASGQVLMHAAKGSHERKLLFDAGPQGMLACGHGHADALSIVCAADGQEWLVDPGTFSYTGSAAWRDFFRSTRAHNTLVVDGRDQADAVDVFKWRNAPAVKLEQFITSPELDFACGSHTGYSRFGQAVCHRRSLLFVKPDYWVVCDDVEGTGEHDLEFFFHFHPGCEVAASTSGWVAEGKTRFALLAAGLPVAWELVSGRGPDAPGGIQGWYSRDYGHKQPAPVAVARARVKLPAQFYWLLLPDPQPGCDFRYLGNGGGVEVTFPRTRDRVLPVVTTDRDGIVTDGRIGLVRLTDSDLPLRLVALNATEIRHRGSQLLRADSPMPYCDISWEQAPVAVNADWRGVLRVRPARGSETVAVNGIPCTAGRDGWAEVRSVGT